MKKNNLVLFTHKRTILIPAIGFFLIFALAIFMLSSYISSIKSSFQSDNSLYLTEINNQIANTIDERIDAKMHILSTIASTMKNPQDFNKPTIQQIIKKEIDSLEFSNIFLLSNDGITTYNNVVYNVFDEPFFKQALSGKQTITEKCFPEISKNPLIIYACPVIINGKTDSMIIGIQNTSSIRLLMKNKAFTSKGFARVTNYDGEYIISTEDNTTSPTLTLQEDISKIWSDYDEGIEQIKDIRSNKKSGTFLYKTEEAANTLIYSPLAHNNWYLFTIIPNNFFSKKSTSLVHLAFFFCGAIGFLLVFFIVFFSLLQVRSQKQLQNLAYIDPLTEHGNFNWFTKTAIKILSTNVKTKYAIISIDVEHFKIVNDRFGRENGDKMLKHIYKWLCINIEKDEIACRTLSDNFMLLIKYHNDQICEERLKKIAKDINAYNDEKNSDEKFYLTIICGVCPIETTNDKTAIESINYDLLACYDRASVAIKASKAIKDYYLKVGFFNEWDLTVMIHQKIIENRMKIALENNEFQVYFQPKYNIKLDKIAGAEALVRWADPTRGLIPPDEFIPLFENNGFILNLDLYVFERTCHIIRQWLDNGINPVIISVNLSRAYLNDFSFLGQFEQIRQKYDVSPKYIELELTETVVFENMTILTDMINLIHDLGYSCSIDDFGSGYSSLNILKNIPVDTIKIDKAFFSGDNADTLKSDNIVKSVIDLAKKLNMKTVSEGIEYGDQVEFLKSAECDMIQGFFYSKPIPIPEFEKLAFGLIISGKTNLPLRQSEDQIQLEELLDNDQKFSENNFPATAILKKKKPKA